MSGGTGDDALAMMPDGTMASERREYLIGAALQILGDGRTRSAEEIRDAGIAAGVIPAGTPTRYVYAALHEYIFRSVGAGRTPPFVQIEHTEQFRLNEPADEWPPIDLPVPRKRIAAADNTALQMRLRETSTSDDTAGFEVAVCDAFAALGFMTEHIGGTGKPDGVVTAPLGPIGWRTTLECKTASPGKVVANPRPEEPAKFRDAYAATRALLIGPAFGNDASFMDELKVHEVALWTVDDLVLALENELTPAELAPAFASGFAADRLTAAIWERRHGERKRIAVVADTLHRLGWQAQRQLAGSVGAASPRLTAETLLVLADEALAAIDATLIVTRDRLDAAIAKLVVDGLATRTGPDAIVFTTPWAATTTGEASSIRA